MAKKLKSTKIQQIAHFEWRVWTDAHPVDIKAIDGVVSVDGPRDGKWYAVVVDPRYAQNELWDEIEALK